MVAMRVHCKSGNKRYEWGRECNRALDDDDDEKEATKRRRRKNFQLFFG